MFKTTIFLFATYIINYNIITITLANSFKYTNIFKFLISLLYLLFQKFVYYKKFF